MLPIILNIVDDDDRAFVEKIYVKYENKLYLISMKYLNNHHDAQDCVHDTIQLIMEGIDKFKSAHDMGYLEKLLTVVCRNCVLNALRAKKRKNEHEQSLLKYNYDDDEYEESDIPDFSECVDKIYISEENCECLYGLINKLDSKYRDVIMLKSLGLDNRSIARVMNISEELVRKRYSRAKKQLWEMGGKDLYV
ncbi:MAG: sigma-70 family RNA polymerase sigma factor [Ruminococcaceae bacterium]|nr:sigma-70 family RNA polymerase sigma factor [Oscillospiraceae bacterium]